MCKYIENQILIAAMSGNYDEVKKLLAQMNEKEGKTMYDSLDIIMAIMNEMG